MQVSLINNLEKFQQLRTDWEAIYEADPQAQFFLSWIWFYEWFQIKGKGDSWFVLAAKPDHNSSYAAFFPLRMKTNQEDGDKVCDELYMGGNSMADYTGLICLPEYEEETIHAFATYIQENLEWLEWSNFHFKNILETDQRMLLLAKTLANNDFEIYQYHFQNKQDNTNNYCCPYIPLPEDWEQYLQNYLSANTRQKFRRFLRKIDNSDEFKITHVNADNLEQHLQILLDLWQFRWRNRKGEEATELFLKFINHMLRRCFHHNCLYLPVLWQGDVPLAAIANFIDANKKSFLFYIAGRDDTVNNPPPGIVLHTYSIRYAIQNGFKIYDFLRGDEDYKFSFAPETRLIKHILLKRKNVNSQQINSGLKGISTALQFAVQYHQSNSLKEAEKCYSYVLKVQNNYPDALYGMSLIARQKGNFQEAEKFLNTILQFQPESAKTWFSLGNLYQAQTQFQQAESAYKKAITLQPDSASIYNNLGYTLQQQSKFDQAVSCYQNALNVQPNCLEAYVNLGNLLHTQGKLSSDQQIHCGKLNQKLGFSRKKAGDLSTAVAYYQQAILLLGSTQSTNANYDQCVALQTQGELKEAIACYEKVLESNPHYAPDVKA
ncbi:GNAT family N-acetyltransferase [Okeanomitos corallinicola TIOX110]|uniref:GNAT family N-acetyltransferase n=1 Tax=Okeanomitos corallinicola TIOX110 TaxID=3133117 RepID=A0ABZ2UV71_9CYAN